MMPNQNSETAKIILYRKKDECCGCSACYSICPKHAIVMREDEEGFSYPYIQRTQCIECGLCKKVCAYQATLSTSEKNVTLAAAAKDEILLNSSASGGVFSSLATAFLEQGGMVFGCSLETCNDKLSPRHKGITSLEELPKLQGSKYVQSKIGETYFEVKQALEQGRQVLFSGTPCQVDGLKYYLGKTYENLLTIDLICHGVPNAKIFQDYIKCLEAKTKSKVVGFRFRDKSQGWGLCAQAVLKKNGKERKKSLPVYASSYYGMFLDGLIYRDSCYTCKYANKNRVGDLTIGDYWGIEKEHPEFVKKGKDGLMVEKGVSCVIVNTAQGEKFFNQLKEGIAQFPSTFEKAAKENAQLCHPSGHRDLREKILEIYRTEGYEAVELFYRKAQGIDYYKKKVIGMLPSGLKTIIKKLRK